MRLILFGLLLTLAGCRLGGDPPAPTLAEDGHPVALRSPATTVEEPRVERKLAPLPPLAAVVHAHGIPQEGMTGMRDVEVQLELTGASPGSLLAVEFLSPDGSPYERREVTVATGQHHTLTFVLPVAGTFIESASLGGQWTGRFLLDGVELTSSTFEVTP